MSAIAAPAPAAAGAPSPTPSDPPKKGGLTAKKLGLGLFVFWLAGLIFFIAVFGFKPHKAAQVADNVFTPTDEVKLDTWFNLGPVDFNKGVLYVLLAGVITLGVGLYVVRRLRVRPGRLQVV